MENLRKIIRQKIVTWLRVGDTDVGSNVYDAHAMNLFPNVLPAMNVYTQSKRLDEPRKSKLTRLITKRRVTVLNLVILKAIG